MGMVVEVEQSFEGIMEHLCDAFQSGKTLSELSSNFYGKAKNTQEMRDALVLMTCRCWHEKW